MHAPFGAEVQLFQSNLVALGDLLGCIVSWEIEVVGGPSPLANYKTRDRETLAQHRIV